jgi:hypothetical protein
MAEEFSYKATRKGPHDQWTAASSADSRHLLSLTLRTDTIFLHPPEDGETKRGEPPRTFRPHPKNTQITKPIGIGMPCPFELKSGATKKLSARLSSRDISQPLMFGQNRFQVFDLFRFHCFFLHFHPSSSTVRLGLESNTKGLYRQKSRLSRNSKQMGDSRLESVR